MLVYHISVLKQGLAVTFSGAPVLRGTNIRLCDQPNSHHVLFGSLAVTCEQGPYFVLN